MKPGQGHLFTHIISRTPGESIAAGLRAGDGPDPDASKFRRQHEDYLAALSEAGVEVICLPALETFPDSVFVEDPALCLPDGAILLRPGAESRAGEADEMRPILEQEFSRLHKLKGPGFVDGGDIMVTDTEILVGMSARTNKEGYSELSDLLQSWGYTSRMVETPTEILHFKTASAYLGNNTVLCTKPMAETGVFDEYEVLLTAEGEDAVANAIRVNETIFLSASFPKTTSMLKAHFPELNIVELDTSEAARVDGGLSCMSLRFAKA